MRLRRSPARRRARALAPKTQAGALLRSERVRFVVGHAAHRRRWVAAPRPDLALRAQEARRLQCTPRPCGVLKRFAVLQHESRREGAPSQTAATGSSELRLVPMEVGAPQAPEREHECMSAEHGRTREHGSRQRHRVKVTARSSHSDGPPSTADPNPPRRASFESYAAPFFRKGVDSRI